MLPEFTKPPTNLLRPGTYVDAASADDSEGSNSSQQLQGPCQASTIGGVPLKLKPAAAHLESNLVKHEGEIAMHKGRLRVIRLLSGRSRFMKYHVLSPVLKVQWELITEILDVLKPFLTELAEELLCLYCRSHFEDRASAVICSVCGTWHHRTCWEENGRCSIFGCEGEQLAITDHE